MASPLRSGARIAGELQIGVGAYPDLEVASAFEERLDDRPADEVWRDSQECPGSVEVGDNLHPDRRPTETRLDDERWGEVGLGARCEVESG